MSEDNNNTPVASRPDSISDSPKPIPDGFENNRELESITENVQAKHDSVIHDDMYPNESGMDKPMVVAGIQLDIMSLVTLKWLRKAGSVLVDGVVPRTPEEIGREVSIFLLAHDKAKTVRERAKIFMLAPEDLDIELELVMHEIPLVDVADVFELVADKIISETSTLVIPITEDGDSGEAGSAKKKG